MKRRDLVKILEEMGCVLGRHGGNHDWYTNPQTKQSQPVPRHNEINEHLANNHQEVEGRLARLTIISEPA